MMVFRVCFVFVFCIFDLNLCVYVLFMLMSDVYDSVLRGHTCVC